MIIDKKYITENRYRLIKLQNSINRFFKRFGLDIKVDLSYHGSYLVGGENIHYRTDMETGQKDAELFKNFVNKDSVVLDIGCGGGRVEKFLADHVKEIHGIDMSPKAVKISRKFVDKPNAFFHAVTNNKLDLFKDETFDFVFEIAAFHHMPREDAYNYFVEIFRTLKKGGVFFSTFNDITADFNYNYFAYHALLNDYTVNRMRFYTEEEIKFLLEKVGFRDVEIALWKDRWGVDAVKYVTAKK
jgi:cyclopropane fatty-acyl-phospholipid synthase-like methyltransferase